MAGLRSRNKGKAGEREAAAELTKLGIEAKRCGQQGDGGSETDPDVRSALPHCHIEVKRCEALSLYPAIEQATKDGGGKAPVVLHRRNRKEWVAIVPLDRLPEVAADVYLTLHQD